MIRYVRRLPEVWFYAIVTWLMTHANSRVNLAILALFSAFLTLMVGIAPVHAELSPDAGIESEEFELQQEEEARLAKEEADRLKAEEAARKAAEAKKLAAKKAAEAAAAKAKAAAEAEAKRKAELAEKLGDAAVALSSTLTPVANYADNVSIAAKDLPQGLTPTIVSEALSTSAGKTASVTIRTLPGASCDIDVFVVNRTPLSLAGLENKVAGEDGLCSWKWTTKSNTPRGSWGVRILASKDGKSDDVWTTLNIGNVR